MARIFESGVYTAVKRTDPLLIGDILESIEEILDATPASREQFETDKYRASHLLRHLQILGEAAWRLSVDIKKAYPDIPWNLIAGMRHTLVHDYFEIDWNRVYETVLKDIPALYPQIQAILDDLSADDQQ